jgi:hypothetical protein
MPRLNLSEPKSTSPRNDKMSKEGCNMIRTMKSVTLKMLSENYKMTFALL